MGKKRKKGISTSDKGLAFAVRSGDIKLNMLPDKKQKKIKGIVKGPIDTKNLEKSAKNKYKISKRKVKHIKKNESDEMDINFKDFIENLEDWENNLEGGLADDKTPSDFDIDSLSDGAETEMEHTDDPNIAIEIAMDHIEEHPDYYDEEIGLPSMERELEKQKNNDITMEKRFVTKFKRFSKVNEDNEPEPQKIPRENKWKGTIEYDEEIIKSLEDHNFTLEEGASAEPEDFVIFDIMDKAYKFTSEMPEDIRPYIPQAFDHVMNNL